MENPGWGIATAIVGQSQGIPPSPHKKDKVPICWQSTLGRLISDASFERMPFRRLFMRDRTQQVSNQEVKDRLAMAHPNAEGVGFGTKPRLRFEGCTTKRNALCKWGANSPRRFATAVAAVKASQAFTPSKERIFKGVIHAALQRHVR